MKCPRRPTTSEEVHQVREYEKGFRDGHKAGYADKLLQFRSALYWTGRECAPNWYEQGYNDGYVQGRRHVQPFCYLMLDLGFPLPSLRELVIEQGWKITKEGDYTCVRRRGKLLVIRKTERAALRAALVNYGPFYSTER